MSGLERKVRLPHDNVVVFLPRYQASAGDFAFFGACVGNDVSARVGDFPATVAGVYGLSTRIKASSFRG